MATTLSLLPSRRKYRAWRRTPEGKAYTDDANRQRRETPVYAHYYRWYNRWLGRRRAFRLAGLTVPAPRVVGGRVLFGATLEHYLTPDEQAVYASGAYLTQLPVRAAHRRQGRRLTPPEVAYVKAELARVGAVSGDGTMLRLSREIGCSLPTISLIARGLRHPDPLHLSRLLEHAPLALPAPARAPEVA